MTSLDEPRASYYGQMKQDPVTGRKQPQYPRWKTYTKVIIYEELWVEFDDF